MFVVGTTNRLRMINIEANLFSATFICTNIRRIYKVWVYHNTMWMPGIERLSGTCDGQIRGRMSIHLILYCPLKEDEQLFSEYREDMIEWGLHWNGIVFGDEREMDCELESPVPSAAWTQCWSCIITFEKTFFSFTITLFWILSTRLKITWELTWKRRGRKWKVLINSNSRVTPEVIIPNWKENGEQFFYCTILEFLFLSNISNFS